MTSRSGCRHGVQSVYEETEEAHYSYEAHDVQDCGSDNCKSKYEAHQQVENRNANAQVSDCRTASLATKGWMVSFGERIEKSMFISQ